MPSTTPCCLEKARGSGVSSYLRLPLRTKALPHNLRTRLVPQIFTSPKSRRSILNGILNSQPRARRQIKLQADTHSREPGNQASGAPRSPQSWMKPETSGHKTTVQHKFYSFPSKAVLVNASALRASPSSVGLSSSRSRYVRASQGEPPPLQMPPLPPPQEPLPHTQGSHPRDKSTDPSPPRKGPSRLTGFLQDKTSSESKAPPSSLFCF